MIRACRPSTGLLGRISLTLAMLAVALKVLVPGGFMAAAPAANALPFALVICTGQGPMTLASGEVLADQGKAPGGKAPSGKTPDGKTGHDSPCAFAGHGAGVAPPSLIATAAVTFVAYRAPQQRPLTDLAPGRGLAAPPLPARGPPILLI